jgi:hypothetical protein
MNMDVLTQWWRKVLLKALTKPCEVAAQLNVDVQDLCAKLRWANAYRAVLERWLDIVDVAEKAKTVVRTDGYGQNTVALLREVFSELFEQNLCAPAHRLSLKPCACRRQTQLKPSYGFLPC